MSKQIPKVSVVMPAFNSSRYIKAAINSVRAQRFEEWELLVVDGGSSDNTRDIVTQMSMADSRIFLIINHNDQGPAHARSTGVRKAQGEFIAFLDADDLWLPAKLSTQLNFMLSIESEFSYTKYRVMNAQGTEASCPVSIYSQYDYPSYLFLRGIACSTVMVKRALFSEDILNTFGLWHGEDTLWWIKLLRAGAIARGTPASLVLYRDAEGSLSKHRFRNQASVWRIYRDDFSLPMLVAAAAYVCYVIDVAVRRMWYRIRTKFIGTSKVRELIA
jgi:teichuronic acid biosynthesis glycosyltransferase TuaG